MNNGLFYWTQGILAVVIWLTVFALMIFIPIFLYRYSKRADQKMADADYNFEGSGSAETSHPSHSLHESIWEKFQKSNEDYGTLTPQERQFLYAYEFDSRLLGGGLESFFVEVPHDQAWNETSLALRAVGAEPWYDIFVRMTERDRESIIQYLHSDSEDPIPFSEDWDQQFWDGRSGTTFDEKLPYMENLLDAFALTYFKKGMAL